MKLMRTSKITWPKKPRFLVNEVWINLYWLQENSSWAVVLARDFKLTHHDWITNEVTDRKGCFWIFEHLLYQLTNGERPEKWMELGFLLEIAQNQSLEEIR